MSNILFVLVVVVACYHGISEAALGEDCQNSETCKASVAESVCIDRVCSCPRGYVPHPRNTKCLATVGHGQTCEESIQCNYSNQTECYNGVCRCNANFNYNGRRCAGSLGLGSTCSDDSECVVEMDPKQKTVWCYGGLCVCRGGYKADNNRCIIGGDCTNDDNCKDLENSYCDTRVRQRYRCACRDSFLAVANNTFCYPIVHELGNGCDYHEQCTAKLGQSQCKNFKCVCIDGVTINDNKTCGRSGSATTAVVSLSSFLLVWLAKVL